MKGCYNYQKFHECQRIAESDAICKEPTASLYRAKCLFQLYRKALNLYEFEKLEQQNVQKYLGILKHVKTVISLLGAALQESYIDEEGKEQLDVAMMDIIRGSNELNKITHPRCMLCLRSDVSLQKSHVYPRSLLQEFAESIEEREGGKLFTMVNSTSPKWLYRYSSSKDVRYFMLCLQCEDLVNKGGEIHFHRVFFLKIYNKSEPSQVMKETTLTYGPWLYHFCISLVFRCITSATGIPEIVNRHEVYNLFLACRRFLVSPDEVSETTLPKVYLFINPTQVPKKFEHCCLREALNAPGFFTIQTTDLLDGFSVKPLKGHFAVAHCGIINILLKFYPADEVSLPSDWEVNPQGGIYTVPAEGDREKNIPEGVWSMFQQISKTYHHYIVQSLFQKKDRPPEVKKFTEIDTHQYPHQKAWSKSGIFPDSYLYNSESASLMSMLPSGFKIDCFTREVILPAKYSILTHHTFVSPDEAKVTLLAGVVESDSSMPTPFIIFCRFVSLGGFFVGFSVTDFDKTTYHLKNMCETDLNKFPEEIQQGATFAKEFISELFPPSLMKKGITSLQSLVYNHIYK